MSRHHVQLPRTRRWQRLRLAAFTRDKYRCRECGRPGALEAHHVIALEDGGAVYDLENIATMCRDCHVEHHRPKDVPGAKAWREFVAEMCAAH